MTTHILTVGEFGKAVADSLEELVGNITRTEIAGTAAAGEWPSADAYVLASWRPVPALARLVDSLTHAWRRPFLEIVMEGSTLRVGPMTAPGQSACYTCFASRRLQHSRTPDWDLALERHYDEDSRRGPAGFLKPFASIAATQAATFLSGPTPGKVWRLDLILRNVSYTEVVGVHGCPRCGLGRDESSRSYRDLQADVLRLRREAAAHA